MELKMEGERGSGTEGGGREGEVELKVEGER